MAAILKLRNQFVSGVVECRALFQHCLNPVGSHTDAGVEAAFLQMFKGWELFLESCTIAFMCQRLRADGRSVACYCSSPSEEYARKVLLQDRPFLEWTDADKVLRRWEGIFLRPCLLDNGLRAAKSDLKQMRIIRNSIAHFSSASDEHFRGLIQNEFGGRRHLGRPAELLKSQWAQNPTITYFDRYADVVENLAPLLTG